MTQVVYNMHSLVVYRARNRVLMIAVLLYNMLSKKQQRVIFAYSPQDYFVFKFAARVSLYFTRTLLTSSEI